jgi:hypothetical protein
MRRPRRIRLQAAIRVLMDCRLQDRSGHERLRLLPRLDGQGLAPQSGARWHRVCPWLLPQGRNVCPPPHSKGAVTTVLVAADCGARLPIHGPSATIRSRRGRSRRAPARRPAALSTRSWLSPLRWLLPVALPLERREPLDHQLAHGRALGWPRPNGAAPVLDRGQQLRLDPDAYLFRHLRPPLHAPRYTRAAQFSLVKRWYVCLTLVP